MSKKNSIRKYTVSTLLATAFAFSPVIAGSVFAHGAPDINVNDAAGESTGAGVAVLSQGEQGQAVTDVQQKLQNHGYDVVADGIYGPNTQENIIEFQNDQGWNADGVVDTPTLNALNDGNNLAKEVGMANEDNGNEPTVVKSNHSQVQSLSVGTTGANSGDTVSIASSLVGTPYVFGGTDPDVGLDSSGFINEVFKEQGIGLSRTHAGMWANDGVHVDSPSPGDVVFFAGTYKSGVSHSGIYLGNHQMIHAGTESTGVEVTTPESWEYYWADHYIGAKSFK